MKEYYCMNYYVNDKLSKRLSSSFHKLYEHIKRLEGTDLKVQFDSIISIEYDTTEDLLETINDYFVKG